MDLQREVGLGIFMQGCPSRHSRRKSERKGKSELKILVSSSVGLQVNSWIWPGGFVSNIVPLEQSS